MEKELTPEEIEAEKEHCQALQDQEAAAAEHEAMCREQAEYEAQQEADEASFHNSQCGPEY